MIYVVGLGPGSENYILPIAIKTIKSCDLVIGAKRNLEVVKEYSKSTMDLKEGFSNIADYLKESFNNDIAVVVSGDTGFHSMLSFVKRTVDEKFIKTVPGISSLQYMFAKINKGYEQAKWISLHGKNTDMIELIKDRISLGILLDKEQNVNYVALKLKEQKAFNAVIYVGEHLSYDDEKITKLSIEEAIKYKSETLSVVVVDYE